MTTPTIAVKESLDDLKGIGPSTGISGFKLVYVIGKGLYQYKTGDQSSNVPSGNDGDVWVAPAEDTSGKSGAWQLDGSGILDPEHATDSGTDTYVSATNTTVPGDGVTITRDFQSANTTTTPTLDGKTMTTRDGSALWAGAVSGPHELQYASGTDTYLVLEPILTRLFEGTVSGIIPSNNATDGDHDIDFTQGVIFGPDADAFAVLPALTKRFDAAFAAGSGNGGLGDTVSLPADGDIHFIAIQNDSDGTYDIYGDTDVSGSNVPTGWALIRRVCSLTTDGSSNFIPVSTRDNSGGALEVLIDPVNDVSTTNPGTAAVLNTLSVPSDLKVNALVSFAVTDNAPNRTVRALITSPDVPDVSPSATIHNAITVNQGSATPFSNTAIVANVRTDSSGRVRTRVDTSDADIIYRVTTFGWIDNRGV